MTTPTLCAPIDVRDTDAVLTLDADDQLAEVVDAYFALAARNEWERERKRQAFYAEQSEDAQAAIDREHAVIRAEILAKVEKLRRPHAKALAAD